MKFLQTLRTQVKTDLTSLGQVLSWFEQIDRPIVPHSVWLQCQIALAEAFTNVVRYAHRGKPEETPIEIEVTIGNQSLEIRIWDYGTAFDLENFLKKKPHASEYDEGGRGLHLMEKIADVLKYFRTDDQRNCLLIVKKLTSATS